MCQQRCSHHGGQQQRSPAGAAFLLLAAVGVALGLALAGPKAAAVTPSSVLAWVGGQRPNLHLRLPGGLLGGSPADRAVAYALGQRGKPYGWGKHGPASFDCSGLTWAAWHRAGVEIPRTAAAQLAGLPRVAGPRKPGDLIVYATSGPSRRHVAMVVAPGRMVEARGAGTRVRVVPIRRGELGSVRPGAR